MVTKYWWNCQGRTCREDVIACGWQENDGSSSINKVGNGPGSVVSGTASAGRQIMSGD